MSLSDLLKKQKTRFSNICERLATLKKKFMVGIYPNDSPQLKGWNTFKGLTYFLSTEVKKASNHINVLALKKVRTHSVTICILCVFLEGCTVYYV